MSGRCSPSGRATRLNLFSRSQLDPVANKVCEGSRKCERAEICAYRQYRCTLSAARLPAAVGVCWRSDRPAQWQIQIAGRNAWPGRCCRREQARGDVSETSTPSRTRRGPSAVRRWAWLRPTSTAQASAAILIFAGSLCHDGGRRQ